ncbi:MAG: hypothetical protein V4697_03575 [Patescibacteria group bacterium]
MPKVKEAEIKKVTPAPLLDDEKETDPELIPGTLEEEELDEDGALDDEELDPFKDKWEE